MISKVDWILYALVVGKAGELDTARKVILRGLGNTLRGLISGGEAANPLVRSGQKKSPIFLPVGGAH